LSWADRRWGALRRAPSKPGHRTGADVIVARRDIPTSYNLAVVMDDALQGVSHGRARPGSVFPPSGVQRPAPGTPRAAAPTISIIASSSAGRTKSCPRARRYRPCRLRHAGASPDDVRRMVGL
ncbi:tRNA glutamyl-Q(34) synthetase GluQRS, partial [Mesorhizobium calcicola]